MKKILFFLLIVSSSVAQTVNQTVEKQYLAYSKLIIDRKINDALDYTNPDMFKIVPRDQMLTAMESIFNNPQLEYRMLMPTASDFGPVKKMNAKNYVRFISHNIVEMRLNTTTAAKTAEEEMIAKESMQVGLEQKFGKENVSYNDKTGFYKIKTTKAVVASSEDLANWKFLVVDNPKLKTMLAGIIPAEMLE